MEQLVTISIPTFNSASFLERCLKAIHCQTYKNIEVNIVDGNSQDSTVEIAKKFGAKIINCPGALLGARHEGLKIANGEYILLLDSDQIMESACIERAVAEMGNAKDMLILEEDVYRCDNFIEKLFHYDRKLIHGVKDFDPTTSVMLPRFYRTEILKKAFSNIPADVLKNVGGQDHAIIYFEAWNISHRVGLLPNAVKHIEPNSLGAMWRKFYRWGYTSVDARNNKYTDLLSKKERFRKGLFKNGLWKESMASISLLLIKGVPYKIGYFVGKFKKIQ
jgi:glycosyltransferase involved in cell wall biosynthesis